MFSVALSVVDMLPAGVSLTSSVAIVEIIDNDEALVPAVELGFDPVTYRVGEGSGTVELRVSVLSGVLMETITLSYETSDGSAVAGDDYALTTGTLTLSSGISSFTFTVKILEDLDNVDVELAGVFSVALSVVDMLPAGVSLTSSVAIVEIIDNDQPLPGAVTATLSLARVTLLEGETATVEIRLTGNAPADLTFTLVQISGTATGTDYTLTPIVALIPAGANRSTVSIFAVNDSDPEAVESFTLRLESVSTRVAIGTTGSITVTIPENDKPAGITVTPITPVTEGDPIIVEVVLDAVSSDTVTVILVDAFTGSAEAGGVDYTLPVRLSEQITIGETRAIFRISTTLNDFLYEGDETVDLEFSVMGSSIVVPATALIRDADQAPTVSFAPSQPTTVIESSSVGILLRLGDAQLVSDLTVEFEVDLASTATSADYVVGSSVVIAAGEPFVMLTLTAASDRVYDGGVRETVELRLTGVSGGGLPGITLGSRITHVVSIIDAQLPPSVSFAASQPTTVAEGSSVDILVELDGALTDDEVVVDFTVSGTADEGVDYDSPGTRVTILPGEVTALISLVARADNRYDGGMTETVELVLTAASGGVTLGDSITHAVTIIDDEQLVTSPAPADLTATLSVESVTLLEGETGQFEIRLTANAPSNLTFTLDYVPGGSAQAGDYSLSPTVIVISAGSDRVTVELEVDDDVVEEGEESFMLELMSVLSRVAIGTTGTLMVTIPENDQPVPPAVDVTATLSLGSVTLEEGDTERFEIRLSVNAPVDLTFTLDYVGGGSAEVGDYSLSPTVIVIVAGADSVTVAVTVVDDSVAEVEESFELRLNSVLPSVAIAPTGSITVTIPENDQPTTPEATDVEFVVTSATINEGDEYEIELRLVDSMGNASSYSQDIVVTLAVNTNSDTTLSDDEYLLDGEQRFSTMVTIPANESTGTVLFQSVGDNIDELDEYITLRISAADQVSWDVNMTLRINVHDDDDPPVVIGFDRDAYRVSEGSGSLTLTVSVISGVLTETITLSYVVSDVSTTVSDDYTVTVDVLELSMMTPSVTISVDITDDTSYEPDEEFTVELSGAPAGITLDPATATVSIIDNDAVVIGFDRDAYRVSEGSGSLTLTVSVISGVLTETLRLSYVVSDVSTTVSDDYTVTVDVLELSMMTPSVTISVDITDDTSYEPDEEFTVELSGAPVGVSFNPTRATVTIIDNDAVVIGFDRAAYRVSEGSGSLTLTVSVISGMLTETLRLSYVVSDVSTTVSDDYTVTVDVLELSMMTPSVTISVDITEDATLESEEEFTVELIGAPVGVSFNPTKATVTIIDKDAVEIGFDRAAYRVSEGSGSLTLTVSVISGVLMETITLSYVVSDVSTTGSDDYTVTVEMLELSLMTPSVTISVDITDDTSYEPEEEFTVELMGAPVGVSFNPPKATVTIIDDDVVVIGFDRDAYSVAENAGQVILTVSVINGVLLDAITLNFATSDGSAKFGTDYTLTTGTVTLSLMTPSVTLSVDIIDDPTHESAEEFTVELNGASAGITLDPAIATVTISANDQPVAPPPIIVVPPIVVVPPPPTGGGGGGGGGGDPDPVTVSLDQSEQTVDEGNDIEVTVSLSEASDQDITVILTASGGTADTDDHGLVMQEMTIEAGDLTARFTISTTDDNSYEGDETLILRLRSSVDVERNARESTITISDNDPVPTLSLEPNNPSVREGDSVTVRARLSNPSAEAILVALILEDGTAMLGSDYPPPVEFSAEIAPGAEFAEFIISTIDNSVYEPIETVLLQLIVVEGDVIEGTLAGTLSITDDDPMPTLSIEAPDEIIEGTTELVTIRLSGMAANPVTVRVSVGSDSNVSEDDYTLSPAEVTIEPGQLDATVMLSAVDDGRPEISEILVLEVASDELEPVQHRITIPGLATALVDVDSEAEWCDPSGVACVDVTAGTYSEPLLLFIEQASDDTTAPTDFMYLPGIPLWDIEFLLESDPNLVVSELDGRVRVSFRAPRDLVEANGGTEMISIATLHEGSTEWELLETTYDEADDSYRFYAYTPRFSYFALIMIDEVSVVEPPVGPPNQPIPLWLLASIVLAVLLAIVIIVLVIHFRKRGSRPPSPPPSPSLLQLPAPAPQLPAPSPSPPQLSAPSPDPSEASVDEGEAVEDSEESVDEGEAVEDLEESVDEGEEEEDLEETVGEEKM